MSKEDDHSSIREPIFIVGSGRSGTTLLHRIVCGHPHMAWFTRPTEFCPSLPILSLLGRLGLKQFGPCSEGGNVLRKCEVPRPDRENPSLTEQHVTDRARRKLTRTVRAHMRWMHKPRFVLKNTNNTMRMRYIREVFPDARFVHIIRDVRAVVNSLLNVGFWPNLRLWWLGKTPAEWQQEGGDQRELAALHWDRQVRQALADSKHLPPAQYHEVRYEALITEPEPTVRRVLEFCHLPWNEGFDVHWRKTPVRTRSLDAWRKSFDADALEAIRRGAGPLLDELGYT